MVELRHGPGLLFKALPEIEFVLALGEGPGEDLDRNDAVELGLLRLVNRPHASAPEDAENLILRKHRLQFLGQR